jgi:hypothetical protein
MTALLSLCGSELHLLFRPSRERAAFVPYTAITPKIHSLICQRYLMNRSGVAWPRFALESGMVTINHFGLALPETSFGSVKDSGFGRGGGARGLQVYLQAKFVSHPG